MLVFFGFLIFKGHSSFLLTHIYKGIIWCIMVYNGIILYIYIYIQIHIDYIEFWRFERVWKVIHPQSTLEGLDQLGKDVAFSRGSFGQQGCLMPRT